MKVLHIYRSEPTGETRKLAAALSVGTHSVTFELFDPVIDYDGLLNFVFSSDRVISWW